MVEKTPAEMLNVRGRRDVTCQRIGFSFLYPRVWKLMLIGAVPFLAIIANAFEHLERSSEFGGAVAAPLLSASLCGYGMLLFFFRNRSV